VCIPPDCACILDGVHCHLVVCGSHMTKLNSKQRARRRADKVRCFAPYPRASWWHRKVAKPHSREPWTTVGDDMWGRRGTPKLVYMENADGSRGDFVFGFQADAISPSLTRRYRCVLAKARRFLMDNTTKRGNLTCNTRLARSTSGIACDLRTSKDLASLASTRISSARHRHSSGRASGGTCSTWAE